MPRSREIRARWMAFKHMHHLPEGNYPEALAVLREVKVTLNRLYGEVWGEVLPIHLPDEPPRDFTTARHRRERCEELIHRLPLDSFTDTADLLEAMQHILDEEIGTLLADSLRQPFRLPPRIATCNGEKVLTFVKKKTDEEDSSAA